MCVIQKQDTVLCIISLDKEGKSSLPSSNFVLYALMINFVKNTISI